MLSKSGSVILNPGVRGKKSKNSISHENYVKFKFQRD